jgi:hypothetical protein
MRYIVMQYQILSRLIANCTINANGLRLLRNPLARTGFARTFGVCFGGTGWALWAT